MTDVEYIETACNAFAMGLRTMPSDWASLAAAARLTLSKGLHAELLHSSEPADVAFRKQHNRLFSPKPTKAKEKVLGSLMPRPTVRNLIYHVCPLKANNGWIDNLKQLAKRIQVFNGKRVFGIATGAGLHDLATVQKTISHLTIPSDREIILPQFIPLPNCPVLREVVTFLPLLLSVANENYNEATFYAHTKANSTAEDQKGAWAWTKMMYRELLDFPDEVMTDLETHEAVGTNQMIWHGGKAPYPNQFSWGGWCFCGTFWWVRHDAVFTHPTWRNFPLDRYSAEAWPSGILSPERCKSRFQPWPLHQYPAPTPYDASLYPELPDA